MASGDLTSTKLNSEMASCAWFDGVDDTITLATTAQDIISSGNISMACWIYPQTLGEASQGRIISDGKFIMRIGTNNVVRVFSDGATGTTTANDALTLNSWNHILITRDSTGVTNHYINGTLNGTADQSSGTPAAATTNIIVGGTASTNFHGGIKGLKLWHKILSAAEIAKEYDYKPVTDSMRGHWKFDGDATDETGRYNGTVNEVSWVGKGSMADLKIAIDGSNLAAVTDKIHLIPIYGRDKNFWMYNVARAV